MFQYEWFMANDDLTYIDAILLSQVKRKVLWLCLIGLVVWQQPFLGLVI
jgi:hypothetical protein